MFSCEFCEISKDNFSYRTPLVAASVYHKLFKKCKTKNSSLHNNLCNNLLAMRDHSPLNKNITPISCVLLVISNVLGFYLLIVVILSLLTLYFEKAFNYCQNISRSIRESISLYVILVLLSFLSSLEADLGLLQHPRWSAFARKDRNKEKNWRKFFLRFSGK